MKTSEIIKQQIADNPVIIYMKGVPDAPQCGFSGNAVMALKSTGVPFSFVDILANMRIKEALPEVSGWPTFPQVFVGGELIGGGDIVVELATKGELRAVLEEATAKTEA